MTNLSTISAAAQAARLLPGGGVTSLQVPGDSHPVIARGRGSHLWDTKGREYVDYLLGSGPLILGHAHPEVVEAVCQQARLGSTFYTVTEQILELTQTLVDHVPCAQMVQFCGSGSQATFYALRIARAATGRSLVLKFEGGFHGGNDYALVSLAPKTGPHFPRGEFDSAGIPTPLLDAVLVAPYNDLEAVEEIALAHADQLAAILVEPYQRVIDPAPGFLEGLRSLATKVGCVLVFDEVVTGFRFGPGGAQEYYGVTPDLACLGKIIGGGYPLAAVAGPRNLMELCDPGRRSTESYVYMSGTLNGNPVAAAAGNATIAVLDRPDSYERLFALGERMRAGLRQVFNAAGMSVQIQGVGPLFQVVITGTPVVDYRTLHSADAAMSRSIARRVFEQGFFLSGEKGYLSLAHTDEDVDRAITAFANAVGAAA